ncbi:MAG: hypothetical protein K0R98_753 [Rickettsiaceae bacterium]|jgi:hypothetical protein|nr:hypothetical protein [Rickettsiaceae bacterium]
MKIIHDGTKVPNNTICGYKPERYPRYDTYGTPLPKHGYYPLEGDELAAYLAQQEEPEDLPPPPEE